MKAIYGMQKKEKSLYENYKISLSKLILLAVIELNENNDYTTIKQKLIQKEMIQMNIKLKQANKLDIHNLMKAYNIETANNITQSDIINIALTEFFKTASDEDVFVKRVKTLKQYTGDQYEL